MTTQAIVEQPRHIVVQPPQKPNVAAITTGAPGCPALSLALSQARDRCKHAAKDNTHHHGYKYASADSVIATASAAMEGTGLSLIPISEELTTLGSGSNTIFALNRAMFLTHQSGEHVHLEVRGWPVIPDKGRPLDKAYAIALTSSLAYKLRDLLQMPRGDGDDMTARVDEPQAEQQSAPAAPVPNEPAPAEATPSPATITADQRQVLVEMIQARKRTTAEVEHMLKSLNLHTIDQLPQNRLNLAMDLMSDGQISTEQVDRISGLVEAKKINWTAFDARLQEKYKVNRLRLLTTRQADEILLALVGK